MLLLKGIVLMGENSSTFQEDHMMMMTSETGGFGMQAADIWQLTPLIL